MEFMSVVTLICLQIAPGAKVPMEKCEAIYKSCIENLASMPGAAEKGLDTYKISEALYHDPLARNKFCK